MLYRATKNSNGVIVSIGMDEGQSGIDDSGNTWCSWTFDTIPSWTLPVGCSTETPLMFCENGTGDGIQVRLDADVIASPNG